MPIFIRAASLLFIYKTWLVTFIGIN